MGQIGVTVKWSILSAAWAGHLGSGRRRGRLGHNVTPQGLGWSEVSVINTCPVM